MTQQTGQSNYGIADSDVDRENGCQKCETAVLSSVYSGFIDYCCDLNLLNGGGAICDSLLLILAEFKDAETEDSVRGRH